ncbi:MAG: Gfo/Idh/MocA family oxidoreductase [Akkermansiaceae bacterium]|nr:Gfo/Idh/MocA family oxidoreductase [Armatimonadota bacterium]
MAFGIAVLGLDHWYTAFGVLDICAASAETPLLSIYEPDAARRAEVSAAYPHAFVTDSAEAALAVPGVELAAICAKTGDAVRLSKQSLNAGKHVVSVKPFARTREEAEDVLRVAALSSRFFGSFEGMQRLQPRAETLRDLIASGIIGDVIAFHQVGHGPLPAPWRGAENGKPSWWIDAEQVPGGAWIDHAIYAVDLARFALKGEITAATGTLANRVHKHLSVEDYGAAILTLTPDAEHRPPVTLNITDTWCTEPGSGYSEYRILGTRGTITADGGNAWVVQTKDGKTRHEWESGAYFRFGGLATILQNGGTPPFTASDAQSNLVACLQVYGL